MTGERYMWGREAGDDLSPQWTEDAIAIMAQSRIRDCVIMLPNPVINRIRPVNRPHRLTVTLQPSAALKAHEARALLAHLLGTLDLDAKPYAIPGTCVEVYADRLEVNDAKP